MRRRVRLNESTLRQMIRESLKNIIREENELDDDPSAWGGIDDYPENETPEEQWRKLDNAQHGDARTDQWDKDFREFTKMPQHTLGQDETDYRLKHDELSAFPRNGEYGEPGIHGMAALNPKLTYGRSPRVYNGWEHYGNPASAKYPDEDEGLPQEYLNSLNESVRRAIKKVIRRKK